MRGEVIACKGLMLKLMADLTMSTDISGVVAARSLPHKSPWTGQRGLKAGGLAIIRAK